MKIRLLFILSLLFINVQAFSFNNENKSRNERKVNFGIKAGFNSSMFLISSFRIKDVTISDFQNNYKIGYLASTFVRFNIDKHFIQPEISYNVNKCEIVFDKLGAQHPDLDPDYAAINSKICSIDIPLLYGYNVIKQDHYGLSLFVGPKLYCIWNSLSQINFENFDQRGIYEELYPFNVSVVVGVGVNISRIFFDFRYEQGLHNISRKVTYDNINTDGSIGISNMILHRREQVLSFSFGFLF